MALGASHAISCAPSVTVVTLEGAFDGGDVAQRCVTRPEWPSDNAHRQKNDSTVATAYRPQPIQRQPDHDRFHHAPNGTAVPGLGDIGPLASKPVMGGKAVLFKKFAAIDCFGSEIDQKDPAKLM